MIFRDKKTHFEIEMFHIVNIGKQDPARSFNDYLVKLAEEFNKELTSTKFSMATGLPKVAVTDSHQIIEDLVIAPKQTCTVPN